METHRNSNRKYIDFHGGSSWWWFFSRHLLNLKNMVSEKFFQISSAPQKSRGFLFKMNHACWGFWEFDFKCLRQAHI